MRCASLIPAVHIELKVYEVVWRRRNEKNTEIVRIRLTVGRNSWRCATNFANTNLRRYCAQKLHESIVLNEYRSRRFSIRERLGIGHAVEASKYADMQYRAVPRSSSTRALEIMNEKGLCFTQMTRWKVHIAHQYAINTRDRVHFQSNLPKTNINNSTLAHNYSAKPWMTN